MCAAHTAHANEVNRTGAVRSSVQYVVSSVDRKVRICCSTAHAGRAPKHPMNNYFWFLRFVSAADKWSLARSSCDRYSMVRKQPPVSNWSFFLLISRNRGRLPLNQRYMFGCVYRWDGADRTGSTGHLDVRKREGSFGTTCDGSSERAIHAY